MTNKTPHCHECGCSLSGARLILNSQWVCPDCAYKREHLDATLVEKHRRRSGPPQAETLFPLPPKRGGRL